MTTPWRQRVAAWQARRSPPAPDVVLDHRRIYILPSGAGYGFFVTLALVLLAAINYQNSMAYALAFTLAGLFVVAMLHTYRNLSGLWIRAQAPAPVFAHEAAQFRLLLESQDRPYLALYVGWSKAQLQRLDLAVGQAQRITLGLAAPHRGWMAAPRIRLETRFPLGLLRAWSWVDLSQQVLVYPAPQPAVLPPRHGPAGDAEDHGWHVLDTGVDDFQGLQAYRPGDSWRRLHWKAFSKGQALLIKSFAEVRGQDVALDIAALEGPLEQRLSVLCHWVLALSSRDESFSLHLTSTSLATATGEPHRDACLYALAMEGL